MTSGVTQKKKITTRKLRLYAYYGEYENNIAFFFFDCIFIHFDMSSLPLHSSNIEWPLKSDKNKFGLWLQFEQQKKKKYTQHISASYSVVIVKYYYTLLLLLLREERFSIFISNIWPFRFFAACSWIVMDKTCWRLKCSIWVHWIII